MTTALPNPAPLDIIYAAHIDNIVSFINGLCINAKDAGAIGDDSTDDTAAIQAALNAMAVASGPAILFFPPGTYKTTAALTIPNMTSKAIIGAGRDATVIKQYTANTPVIKTTAEDTHTIGLKDLTLTYNSAQSAAQTNAYALQFTIAGSGVGNGWYFWNVDNVAFRNAYVGIGITGTGSLSVWESSFSNLLFGAITYRAINMVSPTPIGMPVSTWRNIQILNGGATATSYAIALGGAEAMFEGLAIEDWSQLLVLVTGGMPVSFKGVHIERWTAAVAGYAFNIADGAAYISDIDIDGSPDAASGLYFYGATNSGARLTVERSTLAATIANVATFQYVKGAASSKIWLRNIMNPSGTAVDIPAPVADTTTYGAIVQYDNLFLAGVVGTPGISFAIDPDTGVYRIAANTGGLTAGGAEKLRWDATGVSTDAGASYLNYTWTNVAYASGNFTGGGSLTWTVDSGDQLAYSYLLVGKTMTVTWFIQQSSTGGTANGVLQIAIPASKTAARRTSGTFAYDENGTTGTGFCDVLVAGATVIRLLKNVTATTWSNALTNSLQVTGQITFEIQ